MKKRISEEKGSMAVYVIVVLLSMLFILSAVFLISNTVRRNQIETATKVKESYEADNAKAAEIYGAITGTSTEPTTVAEAIENEYKFTNKTPITDALNNTIYVPGGFHLDRESNTDEEGNAITVEDGIVIEDDQGNQFVWIPTGTYQTSSGAKTNELTRRQWGTSANVEQEPIPISGDSVIASYFYGEGATQDSSGNPITPVSTNIEGFKTSATSNGGFYIGRYEQGEGNVCKAQVDAYVNVTRDEAKTAAEAMYSENSEITATTELISSYAWDTALNFICQNSEYSYELATTTSQDRANIGTRNKTQAGEYAADCYSNIYDLLGNCYEWTTEYSSSADSRYAYSCVFRGGGYNYGGNYAAHCGSTRTADFYSQNSFRLQMYIK